MEVKRAKISSVGHYLPEYRLTNFELEKMVDTNDEWIRTRTGISERRILKDPTKASAFMGAEASKEALEEAGVDPMEIDLIIVATVTPDYLFPATACLVQEMIGAKKLLLSMSQLLVQVLSMHLQPALLSLNLVRQKRF